MSKKEEFIEFVFESGVADAYELEFYKKKQNEAMKMIDELTERLYDTLTPEQIEVFEQIEDYEIEYEDAITKQAFYKGAMLAKEFSNVIKRKTNKYCRGGVLPPASNRFRRNSK